MKKLLLIVGLLLFAGCTAISYNPKTGSIRYTRIGDQQLNGLYATIEPNETHLEIEKQRSDTEAIDILAELVMKLAVTK